VSWFGVRVCSHVVSVHRQVSPRNYRAIRSNISTPPTCSAYARMNTSDVIHPHASVPRNTAHASNLSTSRNGIGQTAAQRPRPCTSNQPGQTDAFTDQVLRYLSPRHFRVVRLSRIRQPRQHIVHFGFERFRHDLDLTDTRFQFVSVFSGQYVDRRAVAVQRFQTVPTLRMSGQTVSRP
jgi:hypothetical protein